MYIVNYASLLYSDCPVGVDEEMESEITLDSYPVLIPQVRFFLLALIHAFLHVLYCIFYMFHTCISLFILLHSIALIFAFLLSFACISTCIYPCIRMHSTTCI
jgi:hypothetical protein